LIRHRIGRLAAMSSAVALLVSAMLAGGTSAANTRTVFFGSPGADGGGYNDDGSLDFGELRNTRVTAGMKTAIIVRIENESGSTLNKVKIAGGEAADEKPYNPLFPAPQDDEGETLPSLPDGATFVAVTPLTSGVTCDPDTATSFQCDFGNLAANGFGELRVIIAAPSAEGDYPYWFTASWNEGWSSTGNNADYNFAVGELDVLEANCVNGTASWFQPNEPVNLDDGDATANVPCVENTSASVRSGQAVGGIGGFAQVLFDEADPACPASLKSTACYGRTVDVKILGGVAVPGKVIWTMQFFGTKTLTGVIHYKDNYNPNDPATYDLISLSKKNKCAGSVVTNCWNEIITSPGGAKPAWVKVEFVTDGNGKGGGWI
jgi:hypothetical protein